MGMRNSRQVRQVEGADSRGWNDYAVYAAFVKSTHDIQFLLRVGMGTGQENRVACWLATSSMPLTTSPTKGSAMSVATQPTVIDRCNHQAAPNQTGAVTLLLRDLANTPRSFRIDDGLARRARETVEWETPTRRAISLMETTLVTGPRPLAHNGRLSIECIALIVEFLEPLPGSVKAVESAALHPRNKQIVGVLQIHQMLDLRFTIERCEACALKGRQALAANRLWVFGFQFAHRFLPIVVDRQTAMRRRKRRAAVRTSSERPTIMSIQTATSRTVGVAASSPRTRATIVLRVKSLPCQNGAAVAPLPSARQPPSSSVPDAAATVRTTPAVISPLAPQRRRGR